MASETGSGALGPLPRKVLGRGARAGRRLLYRTRLVRTVTHARVRALLNGSTIEFDVHPTVEFEPRCRFPTYRGVRGRVELGPGVRIGHDVHFNMRGGTVRIGRDTDVRRLVTMNVEGDLRIGEVVLLSVGAHIHCRERIEIGDLTIIGEYSSIADSNHLRTPPGVAVLQHVESAPVVLGSNIWVGTKAVITRGVTVGDQAFVGANAVVTADVEPGWLVAGIPAKPIRQVPVVEGLEG